MSTQIRPLPVLLSVNEAASLLAVSRSKLYKLMNAGRIRAVKDGKRTKLTTAALREYADSLPCYLPRT